MDLPWNEDKKKTSKDKTSKQATPPPTPEQRARLTVLSGGLDNPWPSAAHRFPDDPNKPLTPKQQTFKNAVLAGNTFADAYREAYDVENMSDEAIRTEGARLAQHPAIALALRVGFEKKEERVLHTGHSLRGLVVEKLLHEAEHAGSDSARVRAIELLGKLDNVQAFKERVGVEEDTRTPEQVLDAVRDKLKTAFNE